MQTLLSIRLVSKYCMPLCQVARFCAFCVSGAFLLTVDSVSFFTYNWSLFAYSFSFLAYSWSFFAYSGKVRLIRALRHCKQRSSTVSKKALTASKKASPVSVVLLCQIDLQKAQICAEVCKKTLLCNTPFSYTPFCLPPSHVRSTIAVVEMIPCHETNT